MLGFIYIKNMFKKLIILSLLVLTTTVKSQTFTNYVDMLVDDKKVFNYNYTEKETITNPLYFFINFSKFSKSISGELKHEDVSYDLFKNTQTPSSGMVIIGPIYEFFSGKQNGNWQFKLETETPLYVDNWGIVEIIPEGNSLMLFVIGGLLLLTTKKKN